MLSVGCLYILPPSRIEETQKNKISWFFLKNGEIRLLENKCEKDRLKIGIRFMHNISYQNKLPRAWESAVRKPCIWPWAICHKSQGRQMLNNLVHSVSAKLPQVFMKWMFAESTVAAQLWISEFYQIPGFESHLPAVQLEANYLTTLCSVSLLYPHGVINTHGS